MVERKGNETQEDESEEKRNCERTGILNLPKGISESIIPVNRMRPWLVTFLSFHGNTRIRFNLFVFASAVSPDPSCGMASQVSAWTSEFQEN